MRDKLCIGIDASWLEGAKYGVARYLYNLLKKWSIVAPQNEYILYTQQTIPDTDTFKHDCFINKVLKKPWFIPWKGPLWNAYCLPAELILHKIDLFFSPSYVLPFIMNTKSVVNIHDMSFERFPECSTPQRRAHVRKSALRADAIITISQYSKREIMEYYRLPESKIHCIYLGTEEIFHSINDRRKIKEIKDKFKINNGFILYVGAIYKRRNVQNLIKAFQNLTSFLKDYQLLIVGKPSPSLDMDLGGLIESTNLQIGKNKIIQINYVEEEFLPWLYNAADLFVYPSSYEGFGLPPLEAMACGTPVMTSDCPAVQEVVGDAAVKIDPNDVDLISKTMLRVLTDERLRKELAKKGLERAKMFSWSKCANETLELFYKVIC